MNRYFFVVTYQESFGEHSDFSFNFSILLFMLALL
jgi:hypothetical protein